VHCSKGDINRQKTQMTFKQLSHGRAEQGAATIPQNFVPVVCLSNFMAWLVSRYEWTGELEDLCEASMQLSKIKTAGGNVLQSPNTFPNISNILNILSILDS